jgi:senataxin
MSANQADVQSLLSNLRDAPVNTDGALDAILAPIYDHLMKVPSTPDGRFHWFCERAEPVTIEASTFLIRLFAYNSPRVDEWKKRFESCVTGCLLCVKGLGELKESSRKT